MSTPATTRQVAEIAQAIRSVCVETACAAYDEAGLQGLCAEGRWEYALAALRRLDLQPFVTLPHSGASSDSMPADARHECANDG